MPTPEQMAKNAEAMAKMDFSILDGTLDDIDDLPSFAVFPSGAYHIILEEGLQRKPVGTHPAVECAMKLIEVKELSNPVQDEGDKPKVGDVCTTAYMLDNPTGQGFLKSNLLEPIGTKLGIKKNQEIIDASKGIQAIVVMERVHQPADAVKGKAARDFCKIIRFVPL